MNLGEVIRITRQKAFYTQEDFAKEMNVALSTVNRWELNKAKPNVKAMKEIKTVTHQTQQYFLRSLHMFMVVRAQFYFFP